MSQYSTNVQLTGQFMSSALSNPTATHLRPNTEPLTLRPCRPTDINEAVPLILSSGSNAFHYVFSASDDHQAEAFLRQAYCDPGSEFGYAQHLAVTEDDRVIAVMAVRQPSQDIGFLWSALKNIVRFYPLRLIAGVLLRGIRTESVIRPPARGEQLIYQVGVSPACQGRGVGSALLLDQLQRLRLEPQAITLNVAEDNLRAKALYEKLGFRESGFVPSTLTSRFGRVEGQYRMRFKS